MTRDNTLRMTELNSGATWLFLFTLFPRSNLASLSMLWYRNTLHHGYFKIFSLQSFIDCPHCILITDALSALGAEPHWSNGKLLMNKVVIYFTFATRQEWGKRKYSAEIDGNAADTSSANYPAKAPPLPISATCVT